MPDDDKNKNKNSVDGLISSKGDLAGSRKIVLDSIGEGALDLKSKPTLESSPDKKNNGKTNGFFVSKKSDSLARKVSKNNIDGIKFLDSFNLLERGMQEESGEIKDASKFGMDAELMEKMEKNEINPTLINDINTRGISFDDLADLSKADIPQPPDTNSEKKDEALDKKTEKKKTKSQTEKKKKVKKTNLTAKKELSPKPKPKVKQKKSIEWKKKFAFLFKASVALSGFKRNFRLYFNKAAVHGLFLLLLFLFVYLAYATTILKFEVDNRLTRFLGKYALVPAYVSSKQVLDFFLWQDIKNYAEAEGRETSRKALARFLALRELSERHKLFFPGLTVIYDQNFLAEIEQKTIMDKRFNPVALNRIEGIGNMMKNKEDFIRVSEKHGDDLGRITINAQNRDLYPPEIKNLATGEISEIIGTGEGYYIYKCFEADETESSLSYVFVESGNFENKLNELMASYRLISLVD